MQNQDADRGSLVIKLLVFCISGLIIVPLTFRDCSPSSHTSVTSELTDEVTYSTAPSPVSMATYPAASPHDAHIVGTWIADEETVGRLQSWGVISPSMIGVPELVLTADNRFRLSQSPFVDSRGSSSPSVLSNGGVWSKYREDGRWKLRLHNSNNDFAVEILRAHHPYSLRMWFVHNSTAMSMTFRKFSDQVPWISVPSPPAPKVN